MPDLVRLLAVLGIVLVNVEFFAGTLFAGFGPEGLTTDLDLALNGLVVSLFTVKSYSLFSLMFGAGLGYQLDRAARTGAGADHFYRRRMIALFAFGLCHAAFFFVGDILVTYAALGTLLWFCRNLDTRTLWRWGIACLVLQASFFFILAGLVLVPDGGEQPPAEPVIAAIDTARRAGDFWAMALARLGTLPFLYSVVLFIQGISVFGYFLIGLAIHRTGRLSKLSDPLWRTGRRIGLPLGLALSLIATLMVDHRAQTLGAAELFGMGVLLIGAPLSSWGYVSLLAALAQRPKAVLPRWLRDAGRGTLSIYILQSITLSLIFNGYGFGLGATPDASTAILVALAVGFGTVFTIAGWIALFGTGPLEYLMRWFVYRPASR